MREIWPIFVAESQLLDLFVAGLLSLSPTAQIQFSHRPLDLLLAGDPHALRLTRSAPWAHL